MTKGGKAGILAGISLLVLLGWLLVERKLISIPDHFSYSAQLDTTIQYYDSNIRVPKQTRIARSRLTFQSLPTGSGNLLVNARLATRKTNGEKLSEIGTQLAVERMSWKLSGISAEPVFLFAPRRAPRASFLYRHITSTAPVKMTYEGSELVDDISLYRYSGRYTSNNAISSVAGNITAWFEPVSGYLVKYRENREFFTLNNGNPLLEKVIHDEYADISINSHLNNAGKYRHRVIIGSVLGPVSVCLFLILLVTYFFSLRVFGWSALLLAATVGVHSLVTTSMDFDIALNIVLVALALSFAAMRLRRASQSAALLALVLATLVLLEYGTGLNLRPGHVISQVADESSAFAPMQASANSAICLLAISMVVLIQSVSRTSLLATVNKLIVSGVLAYAMIAYIGHLIGLKGAYSWSEAVSMTVNAAGALILLILAYATIVSPVYNPGVRYGFDFSVVTIGIVVSVTLWLALLKKEGANVNDALELYASELHHTLKAELTQRELALERKAQRWSSGQEKSYERWTADAGNDFDSIGGYKAFMLINPARKIVRSFPEAIRPENPIDDARMTSLLVSAKTNNRTIYSGLFLEDNEHVVAIIHPLWRDNVFLGYFVGLISASRVIDQVAHQYTAELGMQVRSGQNTIYSSGYTQFAENTKSLQVEWHDINFAISLLPTPAYLERFYTALPVLVLVVGSCFSILAGFSIWLYRDRSTKLASVRKEIRARKAAQTKLENLITYSPNGILLVDSDATIRLSNDAVETMFGYGSRELLGHNIELLIPERYKSPHGTFLKDFFRSPLPRKMGEGREIFGLKKNGEEFPLEVGLTPIDDNGKRQVLCSIVDISMLKSNTSKLLKTQDALLNLLIDARQVQIELENKQNELKATNRELEQFAYVASHDLQEPLRKLVSFSQLLARDLDVELNENARKDLFYIQEAAGRMRALVQDLLALSRAGMSTLSISDCDLNTIIDDVVSMLSSTIEESQADIVREPLPMVRCDRRLVTQLYQNLISNALKFVAPGTRPRIEITRKKSDGDEWVFGVRDNGIGIKPQHRERIFMPFKRLHSSKEYKGTGIGLSVCKKAVERHGGCIWVESDGSGCHFKFTLA